LVLLKIPKCEIGICWTCFSTKYAALRRKSKNRLARIQDNDINYIPRWRINPICCLLALPYVCNEKKSFRDLQQYQFPLKELSLLVTVLFHLLTSFEKKICGIAYFRPFLNVHLVVLYGRWISYKYLLFVLFGHWN
jgi:hypothetical protein